MAKGTKTCSFAPTLLCRWLLPAWLALAAPAHATSEAPASDAPVAERPAGAPCGPVDDSIVVTARRRAETVQTVPLAVTVVGGAHIENTGAFNVGRLTQLTPTLQFYSSNPRNTSVNIRGLGAPLGLTNDGIEQGVGVYIDDVFYARAASSTFDFLDVSRIEVLRGPQGTLFGKNTTAGALNITTRAHVRSRSPAGGHGRQSRLRPAQGRGVRSAQRYPGGAPRRLVHPA
jgi:iron complex outermembrane receptor protein